MHLFNFSVNVENKYIYWKKRVHIKLIFFKVSTLQYQGGEGQNPSVERIPLDWFHDAFGIEFNANNS